MKSVPLYLLLYAVPYSTAIPAAVCCTLQYRYTYCCMLYPTVPLYLLLYAVPHRPATEPLDTQKHFKFKIFSTPKQAK